MIDITASLVTLALNESTKSGFSVLVDSDGRLPERSLTEDEEFLDVVTMLVYETINLDHPMVDSYFLPLTVRDSFERFRDDVRTICLPHLLIRPELDDPSPGFKWVDLTEPDFLDNKKTCIEAYHYIRGRAASTNIVTFFFDGPWTVQQYRRLCEQIMNDGSTEKFTEIHPSNFRRKFETANNIMFLFTPVGEHNVGRGAAVTQYVCTSPVLLEYPRPLF